MNDPVLRDATSRFAVRLRGGAAACVVLLLTAVAPMQADAATLRVATQGDALSMDPHSLAEAVQLSFLGNVYEPLVTRGKQLELQAALATRWRLVSPNVWRFELRRGVRFHDGAPFDADDVLFSLQRARGEGSDMRSQVATVVDVRKVDAYTVDVETQGPNPILPDLITSLYMMSARWARQQGAERPVDRRRGTENAASFRANGTGPYRLRERQPGVRTVLTRHAGYWGQVEGNVDEVVFTPVANDATRVAALVSGETDLIDPLPLQDVPRVQRTSGVKVMQGPESRIVFLGFDQARDELRYGNVKARNPFKDKRVRQAFFLAVDIEAIVTKLMRGAARPAALMVAQGIRGWDAGADRRAPHDPELARKLLAEAGFPDGFEVTLDCPNDRYVNDSEICQAVAAQLARVGVRVRVQAQPKATYFPKVLRRDTSFFMAGWSPAGYDAHNALFALVATPAPPRGQWNLGAYSNPAVDRLVESARVETDPGRRTAMLTEALTLHRDDVGHLPLHQQYLSWGLRESVDGVQRADNFLFFKWFTVKTR